MHFETKLNLVVTTIAVALLITITTAIYYEKTRTELTFPEEYNGKGLHTVEVHYGQRPADKVTYSYSKGEWTIHE